MIATITAALMTLCAAATAQAVSTVRRIHDATISLVTLDRQMVGKAARTSVPEIMYSECKALYLELRKDQKPPGGWAAAWGHGAPPGRGGVRGTPALPCGRDGARPSLAGAATKADLRAAVRTILRGEDVSAAKPGPRITPAKRRQIEAAETYRSTHRGCTLHNACLRSFVPAKGGYKSAMAMYECMRRKT